MRTVFKGLIWLALMALTVGVTLRATTPAIAAGLDDGDESQIEVKKHVSNNGDDWNDADEPDDALKIEPGDSVWWKIVIENKSEMAADVTMIDKLDGERVDLSVDCPELPGALDSGAPGTLVAQTVYTCVYSSTGSLEGLHHNDVKVMATFDVQAMASSGDVTTVDRDTAFYRVEVGEKGDGGEGEKHSEDDEKGDGKKDGDKDGDDKDGDDKHGDDKHGDDKHGDDKHGDDDDRIEVEIEKSISATGPDSPDGSDWKDADEPDDALKVEPGAEIWWEIEVENESSVAVFLTVVDKLDGVPVDLIEECPGFSEPLGPEAEYTCVYSSTAQSIGVHHNGVMVTATTEEKKIAAADGKEREKDVDQDWAFYRVRDGEKDDDDEKDEDQKHHGRIEVEVEKSISIDKTAGASWVDADSWYDALNVTPEKEVWWEVKVENEGTVPVTLVLHDWLDGLPLDPSPDCPDWPVPETPLSLEPEAEYTCVYPSTATTEGAHFNGVKAVAIFEKGTFVHGRVVDADAAFYWVGDGEQGNDLGKGPKGVANFRFWRHNPHLWPILYIIIGHVHYDKWEVIDLIGDDDEGELQVAAVTDMTYRMLSAVAAAKLNVADRNDATCITQAIDLADAWLANNPLGSGVGESDPAWQDGLPLYNTLSDYNNGNLCAPARIASANQFLYLPDVKQ